MGHAGGEAALAAGPRGRRALLGGVEITMGHPRYTKEEIASRGKAIYEQQIRPKVEPEQIGKYLVINIETGEYEMDDDEVTVSQRAYAKHPGAPLFGMRIGSGAWGRIGPHGAATAR